MFKLLVFALSTTLINPVPVLAQAWPDKGLTIVVPTAAGGANDAMARVLAQGLSTRLGKSVIVDNKAGANGAIASESWRAPHPTATPYCLATSPHTASTLPCKNLNMTRSLILKRLAWWPHRRPCWLPTMLYLPKTSRNWCSSSKPNLAPSATHQRATARRHTSLASFLNCLPVLMW